MPDDRSRKRMDEALARATDTRLLRIGRGVVRDLAAVFTHCFGPAEAIVIADSNTFKAAGETVLAILHNSGIFTREPFLFDDPDLHAEYTHVQTLCGVLNKSRAIPIAVGSGTINDLTKLASHQCGRPYLSVTTAASMDGYTSYGASITRTGSKETFFCPAPRAVVADLDILARAPLELNAAGYGDLIAKITSGADWIVADCLGIEAIDPVAWEMVQAPLRSWIARPDDIRLGDPDALQGLIEGLLMTGFAMQWCKSSRPASGADHQFSHLWDMQNHRHEGHVPLHGFKVAVGTMASTLLYETLLEQGMEAVDVERACAAWPSRDALMQTIEETHPLEELRTVARRECEAKYVDSAALGKRLRALKQSWPELTKRLRAQLLPFGELQGMLAAAGAPDHPEQIGIPLPRLRQSYREAHQIRRRYTVLDVAWETGSMPSCLDAIFTGRSRFDEPGGNKGPTP